jgi:hypothetical protein
MKQFFILLFLLPVFAFGQDCNVKKLKDKFSQEPIYSSGFMHFNGSKGEKVSLSIEADSKEIRLLYSLPDNCFNDESTVAFSFDGSKSKSNMKAGNAMNCDGIFTVVFRNTNTTSFGLNKIATQKTTSMNFTGSNGQKIEVVLKEEDKLNLQVKADCLIKEAKSLIKTQ